MNFLLPPRTIDFRCTRELELNIIDSSEIFFYREIDALEKRVELSAEPRAIETRRKGIVRLKSQRLF